MLIFTILHVCVSCLYSGIDIDGDTVGFAYKHTMCSDAHSVGVTQDGGRSLSAVSSTAAHEMGHNFNMDHDGNKVEIKFVILMTSI